MMTIEKFQIIHLVLMGPQYLSLWKALNSATILTDTFNSAIETVESKLGNISELKYDIDEFKRNTDNIMVG